MLVRWALLVVASFPVAVLGKDGNDDGNGKDRKAGYIETSRS